MDYSRHLIHLVASRILISCRWRFYSHCFGYRCDRRINKAPDRSGCLGRSDLGFQDFCSKADKDVNLEKLMISVGVLELSFQGAGPERLAFIAGGSAG